MKLKCLLVKQEGIFLFDRDQKFALLRCRMFYDFNFSRAETILSYIS